MAIDTHRHFCQFNLAQNQHRYHGKLIQFLSIFSDGYPAKQRDHVKPGKGKSMTQNETNKKSAYPLIKKLGLIIIGLFLIYVIAGFWVVPPLLKPRLEKELSSQIGRKVTIEGIKLNPWSCPLPQPI